MLGLGNEAISVLALQYFSMVDPTGNTSQLLQSAGQELPTLYPSLPIAAPWSDNENCRNDSRLLLRALNNFTLWAVQMLDASARQPNEPLLTQYCLVKVSVKISRNISSSNLDPFVQKFDPYLSAWDRIKSDGTPSRVPRNSIYQALCVPASCSHLDIESAVSQHLKKHKSPLGIEYTAEVAPNLCSSLEEEPFTKWDHLFLITTAFFILLVVMGTARDCLSGETQSGSLFSDLLLCFSLKQNFKSLNPSREPSSLDVLNSMKFICMCSIIISHRGAYFGASPLWNLEFLEREFKSTRLALIHRADLIVDNFFVISGLLMAYLLLKELPKRRINAIYLIY
ncbi:hypothetical protein L9F63_010096 [Diploptera punctata]|uniref:Nose resistant-to-fluoxetine protein N-terminal domain-containing protein n=1 Tax=Diploptera punctata TaxID=6984 RepID=A0AAD8ERU2_DIPPU|nr:hypothetical protein L9F63_010096 [Diploptera punctata]